MPYVSYNVLQIPVAHFYPISSMSRWLLVSESQREFFQSLGELSLFETCPVTLPRSATLSFYPCTLSVTRAAENQTPK